LHQQIGRQRGEGIPDQGQAPALALEPEDSPLALTLPR